MGEYLLWRYPKASMRFYPKNDLYDFYRRYAVDTWLSPRIQEHTIRRSLDILNRAINVCPKWGTFLDIGAGSGRYSVVLAQKFSHGYAIEIAKNADLVSVAKKHLNISVLFTSLQRMKIAEKIDCILLADVYEHIPLPDVSASVRKMSRLQEKGGVVYVITPNPITCGPAPESGIYHTRHRFGHQQHYTKREIETEFAACGYVPVFSCYEDSSVRLAVKLLFIGVSFLDKKLQAWPLVWTLTAPIAWCIDSLFMVIGLLVYPFEIWHQFDMFNTRSLVIVFKKEK